MSSDDENKHQNILRVGVLYLAGAWLVVQTIMTLTPVLDWPPIFGFGILFMLIPGFPIVLLMTWVFDVTHKDTGWDKKDDARKANDKPGKGFRIALTFLAGLALAVMLLDIFLLVDGEPVEQEIISVPQEVF